MPNTLKLNKHLNIFGHYLLEGYLLFPTVPRNVGSVTSVNEHEHVRDRLTIWVCTKMLRLRLVPSLWYLVTFFQIVDFTLTGRPGNWWANLFPTSCKLPVRYHSVPVKTLCSFLWATSWSMLAVQICLHSNKHCKQLFLEVSLVSANPLLWTHPWSVIHTRSVLKGNVTKRNTDTKDQESLESISVGHKHDASPQRYTPTLVNAKFKGFWYKVKLSTSL